MKKANIHIAVIFLLSLIVLPFTGCKKKYYFDLGIFNKSCEQVFDVKIELVPSNVFYEKKILSPNTCSWYGNFILQSPSKIKISFKDQKNKKYRFSGKLKPDICRLKIIIDKSQTGTTKHKVFLNQQLSLKN